MSKHKGSTPSGDDSNGYAVGYGKPPTNSRFRPGQSGNPAGRRKGVRNLSTDVKDTLRVPVKVKEGGRSRTMSTQRGALMLLREKALKGDARSLDLLIDLASRFNCEPVETEVAKVLSADDQAILAAYVAESAAAAKPPATAESPGDPASNPAASSDKKAPK